jgi:hypothetical protein
MLIETEDREIEIDRAGRLWGDESRGKGRVDRQRRQTLEADRGDILWRHTEETDCGGRQRN